MKTKRILALSFMGVFAFSSLGAIIYTQKQPVLYTPAFAANGHYSNGDGDTYYNGISDSLTGTELLNALRSLNNSKKKTNGGYKPLLNNELLAQYTDYDPTSNIQYDSYGQPYSKVILSFYSGNKANNGNGMNREHVWPDSRGGNLVEADTHMARPTLTSENSARGNSFYVEGKKSTSAGWDPGAETWGDETYRGDSARIIFYCVVASSQLSLVDKENDNSGNKTMGKLSHLLKWNLNYAVQQRERNRNEGVEYIQGNRNPFIDHPEYACKIWGNYNEETKSICSGSPTPGPVTEANLESLTLVSAPTKLEYKVGESLDKTGMLIKANFDDGTSTNVTDLVTISPNVFDVPGEVTVFAKYIHKTITRAVSFDVKVKAKATNNGCGGNIVTTSIILSSLSLAGISLLIISKNIRNKKKQ